MLTPSIQKAYVTGLAARETRGGIQAYAHGKGSGKPGRALPTLLAVGLQPSVAPNSLWSRLVEGLESRAFTGRAAASLSAFRDLIVSLTAVARQESVSIAIGKMLDRTGYLRELREELTRLGHTFESQTDSEVAAFETDPHLDAQPRRLTEDRRDDLRETVVLPVSEDAEAHQPATASVPCSARTRSAMPAASSPHCASWRARGAA